jgi:hypothetical protein
MLAGMAELGSDLGGVLDVDPALSVVSGRKALAQAVARRCSTPNGQLLWDVSYGYDLRGEVGAIVEASTVEGNIRTQCLLEEEVEDAEVTVTLDQATKTLRAVVRLTDGDGPFTFTIVSQEGLTIEVLAGEAT